MCLAWMAGVQLPILFQAYENLSQVYEINNCKDFYRVC